MLLLYLIELVWLDNWIGFSYSTLSSGLIVEGTIMLVRVPVSGTEHVSTPTAKTSQTNTLTTSHASSWTCFLGLRGLSNA